MDEVRPKTFSAWIIPGVIVAPFTLTKTPAVVMPVILTILCEMYNIPVKKIIVRTNSHSNKPIGSTTEVSYIRQMFFYFMRDVYKAKVEYQHLADFIGMKSHASVMKAIETFHNHIDTNSGIPRNLGTTTVREDYKHFNEIIRPWL